MPEESITEESLRGLYRNLRTDLEAIAWDADTQIAWMDANKWDSDEFALQLDDDYPAAWMLRDRGWLPADADNKITEIDELFRGLGTAEQRWSDEALQSDPDWHRLRLLARETLAIMPPTPGAAPPNDPHA